MANKIITEKLQTQNEITHWNVWDRFILSDDSKVFHIWMWVTVSCRGQSLLCLMSAAGLSHVGTWKWALQTVNPTNGCFLVPMESHKYVHRWVVRVTHRARLRDVVSSIVASDPMNLTSSYRLPCSWRKDVTSRSWWDSWRETHSKIFMSKLYKAAWSHTDTRSMNCLPDVDGCQGDQHKLTVSSISVLIIDRKLLIQSPHSTPDIWPSSHPLQITSQQNVF